MNRSRAFAAPAVLMALAAGCQVQNRYAIVDAPGQPGVAAYSLAKAEWGAYRGSPQTRESRDERLRSILAHLGTALDQDPGVPLFWQCRGRVLQELGDAADSRHCFEQALRRCVDWTPGWLWLAVVHLQQRDAALADRAVAAAWTTIENLRDGGTPPDVVLFGIPLVTTVQPGIRDDHVDAQTGSTRLLQQIHEAVQWDGQAGRMAAGSLVDVLRGYAHYAEFGLIQFRAPEDREAQERCLLAAQRVAPDLWEARYWRAFLAWDRRDYDVAESLLRAYYYGEVAPGQFEPLVRTVYLRICTDAFLERQDDGWRRRAEHAFHALHDRGASYRPEDDLVLAAAEQLFVPDARCATTVAALAGWQPELARDRAIRGQLLVAHGACPPAAIGAAPAAVGGGR